MALSGDYAYVTDYYIGLRVVSVSDPEHPVEVGHCRTPDTPYGVAVSGRYAFVADDDSGLRVISVSDPSNPVEVGYCDMPGYAFGVAANGDYAYVADEAAGLQVLQFYGGGVEESPRPQASSRKLAATVVRSLPADVVAFDAMERRVWNPRSGILFVRERRRQAESRRPSPSARS